jgi:hypothetical protein
VSAFALIGMVGVVADWWLEHRDVDRDAMVEHLTTIAWWGLAGPARPAPSTTDIRRQLG